MAERSVQLNSRQQAIFNNYRASQSGGSSSSQSSQRASSSPSTSSSQGVQLNSTQQGIWDNFVASQGGQNNNQNFRNVIPANAQNTQRINIPTATAPFNQASTASIYGQSSLNADGSPRTALEQSQNRESDIFSTQMNQLFDLQNNRPTNAELFNDAQRESGIVQARQNVSEFSGQLNAIQAQAQASQLQVTGQGRGIPEAIIGGQQAQIAKEAAIQALPVAAQLQAAQGNLEMAQQNMEMLFKIKSEDAKQEFEFKSSLINAVANFSMGQEKAKLQEVQKQEERAYQETQQLFKRAEDFAGRALANNQSTLASKIMSLDHKSPTFNQDLAKLTAQLNDPIKVAQLRKLNQEISQSTVGSSEANENLTAYASQYADTGKLPSPSELKFSNLTIGQVTAMAKQVPRPNGTLVSSNTGVKSSSISSTQEDGIIALKDLTEKLDELRSLPRVGGINTVATYNGLRSEIVDLIARARTGAAISENEEKLYKGKIPSIRSFTQGTKINSLQNSLTGKLNTTLKATGTVMYGYSKVNVGQLGERTVGEILDIGGVNYRVLPDGTLTDIL